MTYTAKIIKNSMLAFLIGTGIGQLFCLSAGEGINIITIGLSALGAGVLIAIGLLLVSLIILITQEGTEHSVVSKRVVLDSDVNQKVMEVTPAQRAGSFALAGLLVLLVGGSVCLGGLSMS